MSLTRSGLGRHIYYLDISQANRFEKLNFVVELLINLDICVVKISVALFLLRIGGLRRWLRVSLFATIALLVSSTSATIIIIFMQCRPIAGIWDPTLKPTAKCLSASALKDVSYLSAGSVPKPIEMLPTLTTLRSYVCFHRLSLRCPPFPDYVGPSNEPKNKSLGAGFALFRLIVRLSLADAYIC